MSGGACTCDFTCPACGQEGDDGDNPASDAMFCRTVGCRVRLFFFKAQGPASVSQKGASR